MSHISANNIDRKLIIVSISMFSNMAVILCQLFSFNMDATFSVLLLHCLYTAARKEGTCLFDINNHNTEYTSVKMLSGDSH